ncbi:glycosyltransferase family 4 protein [Pedobacter cryotolerans]|uniref:Glycosyltransferase family 4 protein n=2 Tax=Pedobacter cryotolerans TaxID=2571270 RepID=A0A4U1BZV8_9SPHI|nr:glycosyltransferase family 4 protein [Pedobacter cryotolerans]
MSAKICFITPNHISSNPRLIKEVRASLAHEYEVHIIFMQNLAYLKLEDQKILDQNPKISYDIIKPKFFTKLLHKLCLAVIKKSGIARYQEFIYSKAYFEFLKKAQQWKADIYIAHNLASLPIAVKAAEKNKAKSGFDAEDFHRNETSDDLESFDVKLKTFIEDKYLTQVDYITCASPLIAESYKTLYPNLDPIVINNVFELKYQPILNKHEGYGIKLFWFSQTIGRDRGLEDIIEAVKQINNPLVELHLLGSINKTDLRYFDILSNFKINYHPPVSGVKIFELASNFDVGLALERKKPFNRNICLTNKIFTYMISGLAVIASDTLAQRAFLEENQEIGFIYETANIHQLRSHIEMLLNEKGRLSDIKRNAYQLAKTKYNWENEARLFINLVRKTLYH